MATVLVAVEREELRTACKRELTAAGHAALELRRPLALLELSGSLAWDVMLIDDSVLGRDSLVISRSGRLSGVPVLALGELPVSGLIPLPLRAADLNATVTAAVEAQSRPAAEPLVRLDQVSRRAMANRREVILTRTEFRLLEYLMQCEPEEVPMAQLVRDVWGFDADTSATDLVRVHIRNLRLKLSQIGLLDVIRSRRGRGYAFVSGVS